MYVIYIVLVIAILVPGAAWASMDIKYGQFRVLEIRKLLINMIYCNFAIVACLILTYNLFDRDISYFDFINDTVDFDRSEILDEIGLFGPDCYSFDNRLALYFKEQLDRMVFDKN